MKRLLISLALVAAPLLASAQVGVSVNIGQPGFYGQINLGNAAPPPVIYANPVIIQAPPPDVVLVPMYLRVPPDQHRNWGRYCHEYNACGRQVYFVSDDWYRNTYAPQYQQEHEYEHEHEHGHGHGHHDDNEEHHGHGHDKDD